MQLTVNSYKSGLSCNQQETVCGMEAGIVDIDLRIIDNEDVNDKVQTGMNPQHTGNNI